MVFSETLQNIDVTYMPCDKLGKTIVTHNFKYILYKTPNTDKIC